MISVSVRRLFRARFKIERLEGKGPAAINLAEQFDHRSVYGEPSNCWFCNPAILNAIPHPRSSAH